jgi:TRAP-type C4-dicarboxylate transport system permease small subunit|tara:strand:- start:1114 stop:1626 length:513 start_codon:yes stop_codon:yes gene_type:complete
VTIVDLVNRLLGVCERLFHVLANACLAAMLGLNIVNIALRAITDKGITWVFPWTVVLFVWMTFFGFFVLYRKHRDITIDFIVDRLGAWAHFASRLLVNGIVLVLMSVMLWHAPTIYEQQVGTIEMVGLERYTMSTPLFVSCVLIFINFVIDTIYAVAGRQEPGDGPVGDT